MQPVRSIAIVAKQSFAPFYDLSHDLLKLFESKSCSAVIHDKCNLGDTICTKNIIEADMVLVLGGDGSLISEARRLCGSSSILAGVNFGRVGFLCELEAETCKDALLSVIEHGLDYEDRLALNFTIERDGKTIAKDTAINDVVITRCGPARLLGFESFLDSDRLNYLRADGLIISTPTGSSAYSSSAGGPLLHPSLNVFSVVAICGFMNNMLPMVMGADSVYSVRIVENQYGACVSLDGQRDFKLAEGDFIKISAQPKAFRIARFGVSSYVEKLHRAWIVHDSPGELKKH